jgi:SSS family solute:Na+ symporter
MDSQLLALSSMLTRDVCQRTLVPAVGLKSKVLVGRLLVATLALLGLAIAYQPPVTILEIATQAFTGLAVLFPTTLATLYWRRTRPRACLVSILVGEALLVGFATGAIPASLALGFLPVIPIVLISSAIVVLGSLAGRRLTGQQAW